MLCSQESVIDHFVSGDEERRRDGQPRPLQFKVYVERHLCSRPMGRSAGRSPLRSIYVACGRAPHREKFAE